MGYQYRGKIRDIEEPWPDMEPVEGESCLDAIGTNKGYKRHKARGEQPCDPCREAHNALNQAERQRKRNLQPCGTNAAYRRHLANGELPCRPCAEAHREVKRQENAKKRATAKQPCGTPAAYQRHKRHQEPVCEPCREAWNERGRRLRQAA